MSTVAQADAGASKSFDKLKSDLFFNERRLGLLLRETLHPEMEQWLGEKQSMRFDCRAECQSCARELDYSVAGKMRGVWNDVKIVQAFDVEVDLRLLVTCPWYEKPSPVSTTETAALIERIRELGALLPGGDVTEATKERVKELMAKFELVDWDRRDVARLTDALQAKETLLKEIGELTRCLQEIGWSCSVHEAKREEVRRKHRRAEIDGEVELSEQYHQEGLDEIEKQMQLILFKLQTIEASQSENAIKRRNNVSQWKLAAAQLETLKEQKMERQRECIRDKGRIDRGLEYEEKKHDALCDEFRQRRAKHDEELVDHAKRQNELQQELHELTQSFKDVERRYSELAEERMATITARVEIVEEEAQRVADYQEFVRFAKEHRKYVEDTQTAAERAALLVNELQRFLMNEQDYDEHDFHQTTRLLGELKVKALLELNQCYNDYHLGLMRQARQVENQIKRAEEEASRQQLLAEVCKETLNPESRRHVSAARDEITRRGALMKQKQQIFRKLEFIQANYLRKVKEDLPAEKVIELDDDIEWETLKKRDEHLDMREELVYPVEYQILDEREDIAAQAERVRAEREEDVNRQCKRGEGKKALLLRKEVERQRKGQEPDTTDPDEESMDLIQRATKAAEDLENAALILEARDQEAKTAAEQLKERTRRAEMRPVAAAYVPDAADADSGAAARGAPAAAGGSPPRPGQPLEARYGHGVFPPSG